MMNSLLLVTDFSAASDRAAERAVLIARQHRMALELAHLASSGPPDVADRLPRCAAMLMRRHRVAVRALGTLDIAGLREAAVARAGLLILGWPPPPVRGLSALRGSLPRQLLPALPCPLLLVRQHAERSYARLLVALGGPPAPAVGLLRAAAAFAPEAELELFHAIDTRDEVRLQAAEATVQSLRAYRQALDHRARQHLHRLADVLDARRNRLLYTLGRGDPARQILVQQDYGQAELVVVGHPRRPRWLEWLCGSTAAALMPRMGCDLLVLPEPVPGGSCQNEGDAGLHLRAPR